MINSPHKGAVVPQPFDVMQIGPQYFVVLGEQDGRPMAAPVVPQSEPLLRSDVQVRDALDLEPMGLGPGVWVVRLAQLSSLRGGEWAGHCAGTMEFRINVTARRAAESRTYEARYRAAEIARPLAPGCTMVPRRGGA